MRCFMLLLRRLRRRDVARQRRARVRNLRLDPRGAIAKIFAVLRDAGAQQLRLLPESALKVP